MNDMLERYIEACNYPGHLDDVAVGKHLRDYITALGIKRDVVRLDRGWSIDDHPALKKQVIQIASDASAVRAAKTAWAARAARAAQAAVAARDAGAAWDASDAWAARDASAARDARDAGTAWTARAAWDAWDARDAHSFAVWCIFYAWDLSWLATLAIGARQIKKNSVSKWSDPVYEAFLAGCWLIYWTDDALYWIAKPKLVFETGSRRLHNANGPALVSNLEDLYFWRGTLIPPEWIENRDSLTAQVALKTNNLEQRRAAIEILGWQRILADLDAKVIDSDNDPHIGTLVAVTLPDLREPAKFLRVKCGTGRDFAIGIPPNINTAIDAQAWIVGLERKDFTVPEIRA